MTILTILAIVFIAGLIFCAGLGYGISRSISKDDYDWEDDEYED